MAISTKQARKEKMIIPETCCVIHRGHVSNYTIKSSTFAYSCLSYIVMLISFCKGK